MWDGGAGTMVLFHRYLQKILASYFCKANPIVYGLEANPFFLVGACAAAGKGIAHGATVKLSMFWTVASCEKLPGLAAH